MNDLVKILSKSQFFNGLEDDEISMFIKKFQCTITEYKDKECIITKDGFSHFIGVILEGTAGIYTDSYYGNHTLIGLADQHYLFGFIAMFYYDQKSITTLYCRKYCKIAYFRLTDINDPVRFIKETSPKILSNIYLMLAKHIRDDFNRAYVTSTPSVMIKLVRHLLSTKLATGSTRFDLVYSRSELANYLGVYRTSLSHAFKELRDKGIITLKEGVVELIKIDSLINLERDSYA